MMQTTAGQSGFEKSLSVHVDIDCISSDIGFHVCSVSVTKDQKWPSISRPSTATEKLRSAPCLASRGILAGLYSTIDDALRANDLQQTIALFQAALAMPMRMRLAPSRQQVCLDSISYYEDLFAAKLATSDSFQV